MNWYSLTKERSARGFSLVEILAGLAILALVVTVGVVHIVKLGESSRVAKLESDVKTVNRAAKMYQLANGDLSSANSAQDVLLRLKTSANSTASKQTAGVTKSFVDRRLDVELQTSREAATGAARAYWNSTSGKFEVSFSGPPGIKKFVLNENATQPTQSTEARSPSLKLATQTGWIWDYADTADDARIAPTVVPLSSAVVAVAAPAPSAPAPLPGATPPPAPAPATGQLLPASYSVAGAAFPINTFPGSVTLSNPNPVGSSRIEFTVNNGAWLVYSGSSITLSPGMSIQSRITTLDPTRWTDSPTASESYTADPVTLDPPIIQKSASNFTTLQPVVTVELVNPNDATVSQLEYRLNGAHWTPYTTAFGIDARTYLSDVLIEARAKPTAEYYLASNLVSDDVRNSSIYTIFSGTTAGAFHTPSGLATMQTNLPAGGSSSLFEWGSVVDTFGNPIPGATVGSLEFTSTSFGMASGYSNRFQVGTLDYHNGSILLDTGADAVSLTVDLDFNIGATRSFDFDFDLINTENFEDPNDLWQDADFVKLQSVYSETLLQAFGQEYRFKLEFGTPTSAGFVNFDEFHVLEDSSASVGLFGSFEVVSP